MINLRRIDLNLLTIFEAVYEEGSQVKAAERLGMTQPAVSQAIARLRYLFDDALFQGNTKGMGTTKKADNLYFRVHNILNLVRDEFPDRGSFNPSITRRIFTIAVSNCIGVMMVKGMTHFIQERAPFSRLTIRTIDPIGDVPLLLKDHKIDVVIHEVCFSESYLEQAYFNEDKFVLIAREDHPRMTLSLSMESLKRECFVTAVDTLPRNMGMYSEEYETIRNRTLVEVPSALIIPQMIIDTDLVAVVTGQMAYNFKQSMPINIYELPWMSSVLRYMTWARTMRNDPGNIWLRSQLAEASRIYC